MGRRAARAFVGMGLAACALAGGRLVVAGAATATPVVASTASDVVVIRGAVPVGGSATGPGWTAGHPETGRYLLVVEGGGSPTITTWEGVASVAVTPIGTGVSLVAFTSPAGTPVDAGFTFVSR